MNNEQRAMAGLCADCDNKLPKAWTAEEIKECKDDLGMGPDDDFADVCAECFTKNYAPASTHAGPATIQ